MQKLTNSIPEHHLYDLVVTCESGVINRTEEITTKEREQWLDWNWPPAEYGRALSVALIPKRDGLPALTMDVPSGCLPHSRIDKSGPFVGDTVTATSRKWRIGYRNGEKVTTIGVDLGDGSQLEEATETFAAVP